MGLYFGRSSFCKCSEPEHNQTKNNETIQDKIKLPNPNPYNFEIIRTKQLDNFLVAEINYPECVNYEGRKILVFENIDIVSLMDSDFIDPHFCDKSHDSPISRFEPTERGWNWAIDFVKIIKRK